MILDEVGTWPAEVIIQRGASVGVTTNITHTEGPTYHEAVWAELLQSDPEPPEPLQDPYCHSCNRNHTRNFCLRKGRSKHFRIK